MTQAIRQKLSESKKARFTALIIVSATMMFGYFFTDVMSPLEDMLNHDLQWNGSEYGFFSGAYGLINVFLLMLFFGGIILDKMGIRFTGMMSTGLMLAGALIKWYAVTFIPTDTIVEWFHLHLFIINIDAPHLSTLIAALGFAIYGVGCEIAGITVSKVIVKWFTGHELALAMGLQVALARFGTLFAMWFSLPIANHLGGVSTSVGLGAALLCAAMLAFMYYCTMDKKLDESVKSEKTEDSEEGFKISDLKILVSNPGFWIICLLCLMFYGGVFPFLKFATKLMIMKYGVEADFAGIIPGLIPVGTMILTPLFGGIYDKKGHGVILMLIGSVLLTIVHVCFALPILNVWWFAVLVMIVLGFAFSLVPSAMWPSVPKIIPMKLLGSAYAMIFFIQNIGLSLIPMGIGEVNQSNTSSDGITDYTTSMTIFAAFGVVSILLSLLLLRLDKKKSYGLEKPNAK